LPCEVAWPGRSSSSSSSSSSQIKTRCTTGLPQVGVSAGGWLARLALGGAPYEAGRVFALASLVHTLVCLGTPHQSLEAYPFGRAEVCE
jgi:hypothetical protein